MLAMQKKDGSILILAHDSESSFKSGYEVFQDGAGRFYSYLNGEGIGADLVRMAGCPAFAEPLDDVSCGVCIFDDGYTDILANAYYENGVEILPAEWREIATA